MSPMSPRLLRPRARGAAAPSDPFFSSVVLLLHMDGSNGSTSFIDSSPSARTMTAADNASISTAQAKFGGASGYFDGDGDGVTAADSADFAFGSGDFTVEAWVYPANNQATNGIYSHRNGDSAQGYGLVLYVYAGSTYLVVSEDGQSWHINSGGEVPVPNNQWSHVALVRNGSTWTVYVNGQVSQSETANFSVYDSSGSPSAGRAGAGSDFYGYIDEMRVTKGVARYTAPFTPPAAPFPNQ